MAERTYSHPQTGCQLILDPSEVFPDDPGAGTPAMVHYKGHSGSYACAVGEGEVDGLCLPADVIQWLESERIVALVDELGA